MLTNLVADRADLPSDSAASASQIDTNLIDPWGIAFEPAGPVWTANNGTATSTLYDGDGNAQALIVSIPNGADGPANPTGVVYNGSADFVVTAGGNSAAAEFIYDGEGGAISGWSAATGNATVIVYDGGSSGAIYKGLAIASTAAGNFLYAANFGNSEVDVFDGNFNKVATAGGFIDPTLPAGYAPFGIQNVQGEIFVSYAQHMPPATNDTLDEVDGAGLGLVDEFDTSGNLLQHLITAGGALNAPWGIALAPADFGPFSNDLLIGNFGDGKINAYDPASGAFQGSLANADGIPLAINGLWGIGFGNGAVNQPLNTLFFAAGTNNEADGTYGRIDVLSTAASGSSSSSGGSSSSSSSSSGGTCTGYGCY